MLPSERLFVTNSEKYPAARPFTTCHAANLPLAWPGVALPFGYSSRSAALMAIHLTASTLEAGVRL